MVTARSFPGLAPLPDGRVLVAGGVQPGGQTRLRSAELFDPDTRSFSPTGAMSFDGGPMGTLPDGRVFVASSPNAEVYDPRSGTFAFAGVISGGSHGRDRPPRWPRRRRESRALVGRLCRGVGPDGADVPTGVRRIASAVRTSDDALDDGRVLVTGGRGTAWAGVFVPATERMTGQRTAASRPASTRLLDGRVLIVGGLETALPTVQIFQ